MSNQPFVHLHNHTEYSLLDGATRIKDMVSRAKEYDMPALAITDHGVMFGCMEFYFECKKQGVKPILGMEAYVAPGGIAKKERGEEKESFHKLLLARNMEGYQNLCKLHTVAALEGFYYRPRVDHELLRAHSKGLISSTTCLGSEVNQALLEGNYDKAQHIAGMYKEMFDEGCYFVELQDHGLPEDKIVNPQLMKIAKELKLPLVVTNDAHYLCKEDADPHDVLLCIGTGSLREDEKRFKFTGEEFYVKTPDEMAKLFPDAPEAMENSLMMAEMCELELGSARAMMPTPDLEEGHNPVTYLRHLAEKGLKDRVQNPDDSYYERLNYELGVIEKTGYDEYFLLVKEFAQYSRDQDIMFGVRGSAAGSLVSYTVGITDVDPVHYDLTFERFLNPERVSMPDVDMDFEDARRDEVIKFVTEKYGSDRVAQIITFGTLGAKAAIRDAARVSGFPPADADKIAKAVPVGPGWSIKKAEQEVADFRDVVKSDPRFGPLVETAKRIEGLSRHAGVHAAGVVISKEPLAETIPLYRSNDGLPVTAYEMGILEKIGMLKMDFLGLSNLTVLAKAINNIKTTYSHLSEEQLMVDHPVLSPDGHRAIPFDDQKTYDMLSRGDTVGVFQLESGGMRRNIIELKPQSVQELAAMVALYRPGPMEHIPRFVSNKFKRTEIEILDAKMEPILAETYGIIVYQDQVLKLVQALAGFTLGKADILRRAMGKKDLAIMTEMKNEFMAGCAENQVSEEVASKVWELLLPFAGYAFNKAHAVCYAILAYQTAYLKANYPVEYMAGLLGAYRGKEDKVTTCIEECRRNKIAILPPDINKSELDFSIEEVEVGKKKEKRKAIRFGLGAIKGVGEGLVRAIIEARESDGPFTHMYEFCDRVRPSGLNKGSLESLIKAGALSSITPNRGTLLSVCEGALVYADNANRQRMAGQDSLFGEGQEEELQLPVIPEQKDFDRNTILNMEKEAMGIYVSDHPLRGYEHVLREHGEVTCSAFQEIEDPRKVTVAGVLSQVSKTLSRNGNRVARITLEDFSGVVSGFCFGETVNKLETVLSKDKVVAVTGRVKFDERSQATERKPELQIYEIVELPAPDIVALDENVEGTVHITVEAMMLSKLRKMYELVLANKGDYQLVFRVVGSSDGKLILPIQRVSADEGFIRQLRRLMESGRVDVLHQNDAYGPPDRGEAQEPSAVRYDTDGTNL